MGNTATYYDSARVSAGENSSQIAYTEGGHLESDFAAYVYTPVADYVGGTREREKQQRRGELMKSL